MEEKRSCFYVSVTGKIRFIKDDISYSFADCQRLLDKGLSITDINDRIGMYTKTGEGSGNWETQLAKNRKGINEVLKRWETNSSTGQGNDGNRFDNDLE